MQYQRTLDITPQTIYFGGGTPSLINPDSLSTILSLFNLSQTTEITLEVNPATVTISEMRRYKEIGINRLSIGAQSTRSSELRLLGRSHTTADLLALYQQGITDIYDNISLDMIYALPHQTLADMNTSLHDLVNLHPQHMSIYCLSLENDVLLYKQAPHLPTDEMTAKMYHHIRETLSHCGFTQYELSSFCRDGKVSAHNLCYWTGEYYLGLGAGASGYIPMQFPSFGGVSAKQTERASSDGINAVPTVTASPIRYQNSMLNDYLSGKYIAHSDTLTPDDIEKEYIITALRLTEGLSLKKYEEKFHISFTDKYAQTLQRLAGKHLIEVNDEAVKLAPDYYFVSNEVLCEFV